MRYLESGPFSGGWTPDYGRNYDSIRWGAPKEEGKAKEEAPSAPVQSPGDGSVDVPAPDETPPRSQEGL
jgi:hypothetical protein